MKVNQTQDILVEADESNSFLERITTSFDLSAGDTGIYSGITFQELHNNILLKLNRKHSENCTSQILFYRIRQILVDEFGKEKNDIKPVSLLNGLFPKARRKKEVLILYNKLGISKTPLTISNYVLIPMIIIFIVSLIYLYFDWQLAMVGIAISISVLIFAGRYFKNYFYAKNLRDLIEEIVTENYIKSRGNTTTINNTEIKNVLEKICYAELGMEEEKIEWQQKIIFG